MFTFYYKAKTHDGKDKSGTMEAKDKHSLAQALRQKGFILTLAQNLEQEEKEAPLLDKIKKIIGRVSLIEKTIFARHLSVMIGAGFSLHKALEALSAQTKNQNFKKIINNIVLSIKKGENLAGAFAHYPKVFDNFFVSMIKVGEKGGKLEEILKILAQHLKRVHKFKSKVKGAMIYPCVIVIAMTAIGILMMVVVIPKITAMFDELDMNLPFTTQILIAVSNFLTNYFILGIFLLIGFIFLLFKLFKTKKGKYVLSWFFLKSPFVKNITKKINCARFARSLSSLMESGVPIVESLTISGQTVNNVFYSDSLLQIAINVKKGKTLHESIEKYKNIYPILVSQMISVGEETGELSEIVARLADFYEEEVTNITDNLASIIEPVLMIIIGIAVGFFAISMIQPMYSMMEGI